MNGSSARPPSLLLNQPLHNQLKFYHSKDGHHNEEAIKTEPTTDKSQNRVHFISTHTPRTGPQS